MSHPKELLPSLPSVEKLASHPRLAEWEPRFSHGIRVRLARETIQRFRETLLRGEIPPISAEAALEQACQALWEGRIQKVINATGVILHTNLGRAPLGREDLNEMAEVLEGYCTLEWNQAHGERGSRTAFVEKLLSLLFDAEASLVVNNNAAALLLMLQELSRGKGCVISRGELVQIGGGFRIPEILEASGARLVEIGTTNMTSMSDYQRAVQSSAKGSLGLILKVHQSCFTIQGHTESVTPKELSPLAEAAGLPLVVDLGSGQFLDEGFGEPTISESLRSGARLVCFSGDKLLGGPQAGIIVGQRAEITRLKNSPLYRALRLGKTELFLLERLCLRLASGRATSTGVLLHQAPGELRDRGERLRRELSAEIPGIGLVEGTGAVGGGTTPGVQLPTWLLELPDVGAETERLVKILLSSRPIVVPRREGKRVRLDLRTVLPNQESELGERLRDSWRALHASSK